MSCQTEVISSAQDFCRSCGACCAYSATWPRFSTETDAELDRIPTTLVAANQSGMRCIGARCAALDGNVGVAASCTIYEIRPVVCRTCVIGDDECQTARAAYGLAPVAATVL